ncbi:MAG: SRPBCC family protein [Pseudomonadota bacterium]
MRIEKTVTVNASADRMWEILGTEYLQSGRWASAVYHSSGKGEPKIAGAPAAGRVCQTSLGPFTETIEAFDPVQRHVAYSATGEKMPSFIKGLTNSWRVTPMGPSASKIEMELTADIAFPFNILMGPMMKMQFGSVVKNVVGELKYYGETGKPHPRKVKVDGTKKARDARAAMA